MKRSVKRAAELLDFPPSSLPSSSKCEISGSEEAIISPCRGIIRYSPDEITVRVSGGRMKITGRGLVMRSCNGMTLRVEGEILSVATAEGTKSK
ncbi:MAG: YabP/YqfC family sporulation protein [Clostridia bacterium]|nr:YabP/YqfC family sporulation protein [Clostridia bacterium]